MVARSVAIELVSSGSFPSVPSVSSIELSWSCGMCGVAILNRSMRSLINMSPKPKGSTLILVSAKALTTSVVLVWSVKVPENKHYMVHVNKQSYESNISNNHHTLHLLSVAGIMF